MAFQASRENAERMSSSTKRISALNDREGHILRHRINAYEKLHNKEVAEVSCQLEEIRQSMKTLALDPLYRTHAFDEIYHAKPRTPVVNGRKCKLRRTQSFPDLLDEDKAFKSSSFPSLKGESANMQSSGSEESEQSRSQPIGATKEKRFEQLSVGDSVYHGTTALARETGSTTRGHRKLERSKTAPVTMLQPLLKTTPQMLREKIHISASYRQSSEDYAAKTFSTARFENASSKFTAHQSNIPVTRNPLNPTRATHDPESGKHCFIKHEFPSKKSKCDGENNSARIRDSFRGKKPIHGIGNAFQKHKATGTAEPVYNADASADLKNCRYLRFAKESQENNRI